MNSDRYWWHGVVLDEVRALAPLGTIVEVRLLAANVKATHGASFTECDVRRYVDDLIASGDLSVVETRPDGRPLNVALAGSTPAAIEQLVQAANEAVARRYALEGRPLGVMATATALSWLASWLVAEEPQVAQRAIKAAEEER